MTRNDWIILICAYIAGLSGANLIGISAEGVAVRQLAVLLGSLSLLAMLCAIALPKPIGRRRIWLGAALVAVLAVGYFQLRIPQPQQDDISNRVTASQSEAVAIGGTVLTEPRLNDNRRLKFVLEASKIDRRERVSGKLYVTVPLLQGTGIYPGAEIELQGVLYLPRAASNPGGFDFKQYLARQGIFAGVRGLQVISVPQTEPWWGWWKIRRRIVRSHLEGLGSPAGQLVSSMVLGRKAVDLPSEIRDRFITSGLAHVLAASGFHVSLLLGIILKLTARFPAKPRLATGIATLLIYLGLTGIQASVFRACLMGTAVLIALAMDTKVKPLGSLLVAATIILLFDPLFIGDLGFQLSFLATFGLIVTLPGLQAKLDWLPPTVATLVAVPLAASIWVLPLLCYVFNTVATYSIFVNILGTPLITIISLGGMISGIASLILPVLGSAIASLLYYPTWLLITATKFVTDLPGSTRAVGQIPLGVLLIIYGLLVLVWLNKWWNKRWWLALLLATTLMVATAIYGASQLQVTVLTNRRSPTIVVRDRGRVILIDSGQKDWAKYTLLPFLARQGINRIDDAIALDPSSNWQTAWAEIAQKLEIGCIFHLHQSNYTVHHQIETCSPNREIVTKTARLSIDKELAVINLQIADLTWLIIDETAKTSDRSSKQQIAQYIKQQGLQTQHPIIIWSGNLKSTWLELLQPQMAISLAERITAQTEQQLRQKQIELYDTAESGAISWILKDGSMNREFPQKQQLTGKIF